MKYRLWTRYDPCKISIRVRTNSPQVIVLKSYDESKKDTFFTNTYHTVNGEEEMFIRMPLAPSVCMMAIYNQKVGNLPKNQDPSFEVLEVKKEELEITLPRTKMDTPLIRNFVAFAQKFCFNAGELAVGRDYVSGAGNFKIEYLKFITNSKGEKMATPARVSTKNGRIQVSQDSFKEFTIPMRMAILLHEFSHYYLNSDIANETEADLNGLTIYLGLGYPIKEAYEAFGVTFIGYPSEQNKRRYDIIDKFIRNYISEYNIKDVYATGK